MNSGKKLSRRGFLRTAAVGAVGAAALSMAACSNGDQPGTTKADPSADYEKEVDVIVLGAGNGGLSASARAAESGKKVLVLEASSWIGGGSRFVGGVTGSGSMHIQGTKNWEAYNAMPYYKHLADPKVGQAVVDTFYGGYVEWLEDIDASFHESKGTQAYQNDYVLGEGGEEGKAGNMAFFDSIAAYGESMGVETIFDMFGQKLLTDEDGSIVGVRAISTADGSIHDYKAPNVILANGGFMCNKGLMSNYVGRSGESVQNIGVPYNTGSGLIMALSAGAQTAGNFDAFNTVTMPFRQNPSASEDVAIYKAIMEGRNPSEGYPEINTSPAPAMLSSLILNLNGKRIYSDYDTQDVLNQPDGQLIVICDKAACDAFDENPSAPYLSSDDYFEFVRETGGFVFEGETVEDLAAAIQGSLSFTPWQAVARSINEYNEYVSSGRGGELDPPAMADQAPALTGPFHAVLCTLGTYYMWGGVKINENAQVIGVNQMPISGLYATIPCASVGTYVGGVAGAGATGFLAANHILDS